MIKCLINTHNNPHNNNISKINNNSSMSNQLIKITTTLLSKFLTNFKQM